MIILSTAHKRQNLVLAVFWSAIGFDCHMISIFIFDQHHVATLAHVQKWRWRAWEYRWQASAEQLSCFVVHWRVAVSDSAVGLMFVGNLYVIVGGDPLMVELLVRPVPGGIQFGNCMPVPSGGVLVAVLFITTHNGGVSSTESRLDISSCVMMEEVDRASDCVCEVWDGGVVIREGIVMRIFLA
jgi:hypothetical protein